jgi:SulP family sulfate permease
MKKMGDAMEERTAVNALQDVIPDATWQDEDMPESFRKKVYVKNLDGPLFFGSASGFQALAKKLPDIKYVIIRMEKVPFVDQSGLYALEEAVLSLEQRGIEVLLTGLQIQPKDRLERIRMIPDLVSKDNIFVSFSDCIKWLQRKNSGTQD